MPKKKEDTADNRHSMSEMSQDDFENYAASTQYSYILLARDIKEREKKNFLGHLDIDLDWTLSYLQQRKQEIYRRSNQDRRSNSQEKRPNTSRGSQHRNSDVNSSESRIRKIVEATKEEHDLALEAIMTALKESKDRNSRSEARISELETKVSRQDSQIEDFKKRIIEQDIRIEKLEQTVSKHQVEIKGLEDTVSQQETEIKDLKEKIIERDSQLEVLNIEHSDLRDILELITQKLSKQEETVKFQYSEIISLIKESLVKNTKK